MKIKSKLVFTQLCGPFIPGWTYKENLLTTYFSDFIDTSVIANRMGFRSNSNKIEFVDEHNDRTFLKVIRIKLNGIIPKIINEKLRIYSRLYDALIAESPDFIFVNGLQFLSLHQVIKYKRAYPEVRVFGELNATSENSASNIISDLILHRIIYRKLIKNCIKYFDKVYYGSQAALEFSVQKYLTDSEYPILPLGVNDFKIKKILEMNNKVILKKFNFSNEDRIIVSGGKFDKHKNLMPLIKAFLEINKSKVRLVIFGSIVEENEELSHLIDENESIEFIGWLDENTMYELFKVSHIAVFPGSKSAIWESAIALGVPLIAQFWSGMDYIDFGGNIEYLHGNGNQTEIKRAIEKLLVDEKLLSNMRRLALEQGLIKLAYSTQAEKIIQDFQEGSKSHGS